MVDIRQSDQQTAIGTRMYSFGFNQQRQDYSRDSETPQWRDHSANTSRNCRLRPHAQSSEFPEIRALVALPFFRNTDHFAHDMLNHLTGSARSRKV